MSSSSFFDHHVDAGFSSNHPNSPWTYVVCVVLVCPTLGDGLSGLLVTLLSISSSNSISVPDHRDCFQLPCNFISMSLQQSINFDDLIGVILVLVFHAKRSVGL